MGETNTIRLAAGTYTLTAADNPMANGLPVITSPLTITGRGLRRPALNGTPAPQGFRILDRSRRPAPHAQAADAARWVGRVEGGDPERGAR